MKSTLPRLLLRGLAALAVCLPAVAMSQPRRPGRPGSPAADRAAIASVARAHVIRQSAIAGRNLRVEVKAVQSGFARVIARAADSSTDPATVYLRKQSGRWRVIAGPGTEWEPRELNRLGIPRAVR